MPETEAEVLYKMVQWVFSGVGVAIISGILVLLISLIGFAYKLGFVTLFAGTPRVVFHMIREPHNW